MYIIIRNITVQPLKLLSRTVMTDIFQLSRRDRMVSDLWITQISIIQVSKSLSSPQTLNEVHSVSHRFNFTNPVENIGLLPLQSLPRPLSASLWTILVIGLGTKPLH